MINCFAPVLFLRRTVIFYLNVMFGPETVLMLAQFMFNSIYLCSPFNNTIHSNHLQAVLILTFREDTYFYLKCLSINLVLLIKQHLLTLYSKVLLEKLTGFQLVNKFPAFYGTQGFVTALKSVRHLSLS